MHAMPSEIEIGGNSKNEKEAQELIPKNNSLVFCTEIERPAMDGLDFTRGKTATDARANFVVSCPGQKADYEKTFQLFGLGAIEIFSMPEHESELGFYASAQELIEKIECVLKRLMNEGIFEYGNSWRIDSNEA